MAQRWRQVLRMPSLLSLVRCRRTLRKRRRRRQTFYGKCVPTMESWFGIIVCHMAFCIILSDVSLSSSAPLDKDLKTTGHENKLEKGNGKANCRNIHAGCDQAG